jgi:hypothetical protein
METSETPKALSFWFVVHFAADVAIAIPLLVAPSWFLTLIGWQTVDPVAARLVAAALFGIGFESLFMRRASLDRFVPMLTLKIIWSVAAIIGFIWSIIEGVHGNPWSIWAFLGIFVAFNILWTWWLAKVRSLLGQR